MSVFDLPGPQFLGLYALLAVATTVVLWALRRPREAPPTAMRRIEDPYQHAFLRDGHKEAVRLVVFSLLHRRLIVAPGGKELRLAVGVSSGHAEHPFEKATLEALRSPGTMASLFSALRRCPVLQRYEEILTRNGLLPDSAATRQRLALWAVGFGALLAVAAIKVAISLSRERPVAFLMIACAIGAMATLIVCFPRRTVTGDQLVAHMNELFQTAERRVNSLMPGRDTNELTWIAAVFGMASLPTDSVPEALRPKQDNSSGGGSGGSSCGSSCGGGCGGGCGGCGG